MVLLTYCVACKHGFHDSCQGGQAAPEGMLGGWRCRCKGECVDRKASAPALPGRADDEIERLQQRGDAVAHAAREVMHGRMHSGELLLAIRAWEGQRPMSAYRDAREAELRGGNAQENARDVAPDRSVTQDPFHATHFDAQDNQVVVACFDIGVGLSVVFDGGSFTDAGKLRAVVADLARGADWLERGIA